MCGRFIFLDDTEIPEINKILREVNMKYEGTDITATTGEIFPTNNVPVCILEDGKPSLTIMKWGFPKWDGMGVIINARSETVTGKRMFAEAFAHRRCVIPSTGFYEWAKTGGKAKEKYRFNDPGNLMLYMAGIYSDYPNACQDEPVTEKFVILTCAADETVSDIHDRMPVLLRKNEITRWLSDYDFARSIIGRDSMSLYGFLVNHSESETENAVLLGGFRGSSKR